MGVLLSQGEVSQVQGAAQGQAVVSGESLAVLIAAHAHLQDPGVAKDLHEAEGQGLLTATEGLQAHQDTAARVGRHLEEGHGRGAALHGHLGRDDRRAGPVSGLESLTELIGFLGLFWRTCKRYPYAVELNPFAVQSQDREESQVALQRGPQLVPVLLGVHHHWGPPQQLLWAGQGGGQPRGLALHHRGGRLRRDGFFEGTRLLPSLRKGLLLLLCPQGAPYEQTS